MSLPAAILFAMVLVGNSLNAQTTGTSFKGSISGKLLDEGGRPLPGWHVMAGHWQYHRGRKEFDLVSPTDSSSSSDGSFRVTNLDAGQYYIRAEEPFARMRELSSIAVKLPTLPSPQRQGTTYITTYFPGVIDVTKATPITVADGGGVSGIEFRMQSARVFRVRGTGGGLQSIKLLDSLIPFDARPIFSTGPTFEVGGLLPGAYVIEGSYRDTASREIVAVTDRDVNNMVVGEAPCPKVRGTITLDGAPVARTFSLSHLDEAIAVGAQAEDEGAFTVSCVPPENYWLNLPIESGEYLKSATLEGKDVTHRPLDLTSVGDKNLDITLSSRAASVHGTVLDSAGRQQLSVPVTVWNAKDDFNVTSLSGPGGAFEIGNLSPGTYHVAAWDQLHPQPDGWGVQTVREFRQVFDAAAIVVTLGHDQHATIQPALISRAAITQVATDLNLNAVMNSAAEMEAISLAVKSPEALARFIGSNLSVDWDLVWKELGVRGPEGEMPRCWLPQQRPCTTEIGKVSDPDQNLIIVRGEELRSANLYLRYLGASNGGWRFSGAYSVPTRDAPIKQQILRMGSKPFLKVLSDRSQVGVATGQTLEEWFDLTQPDLEPAFSFTSDGHQSRFGFGVGRTVQAAAKFTQTGNVERIQLTLNISYDGPGLALPATLFGVYDRTDGERKFTLRTAYSGSQRTPFPAQDFEDLADPFSDLSNEKLLLYAFPGLQKIAKGSDREAKDWLRLVLDTAEDTEEKRGLLKLLDKR